MRDLTFKKADVVKALESQLVEHKTIVQEAWEGHKKRAIEELDRALKDIAAGTRAAVLVHVRAPEDHTEEIERALEMLKMCQEDIVQLDDGEFSMFVQGQWHWVGGFIANNAMYSQTASSKVKY